jgi:hypothetical protein
MEALKESVKRAEEVGQNVSRSITGLAQLVQDSIQENNRTMMQAISQMLHGVGFAPALQSSYTQGEYPLALGFKPPPDVSAKRLPASTIEFTPPATLPGVPTPTLGQTEENQSEERPGGLQSMTASKPRPLVHRVEGLQTGLVGPSKMTSPKPLRLHRVTPLLGQAIFARTEQKIHYLHQLGWKTRRLIGVKSRRRVVVRLYLRCGRRLHQMMTRTLHPCSGQFSALEVLQEPLLQFHHLVRGT